jgi:hypothetical protein
MPDLIQKYNVDEVDPKLETEAEKQAKAQIMLRLQ